MAVVQLELVPVGQLVAEVQAGIDAGVVVGNHRPGVDEPGLPVGQLGPQPGQQPEPAEGAGVGRVEGMDGAVEDEAVGLPRIGDKLSGGRVEILREEVRIAPVGGARIARLELGASAERPDILDDGLGAVLRVPEDLVVRRARLHRRTVEVRIVVGFQLVGRRGMQLEVQLVALGGEGVLPGSRKFQALLILGVEAGPVVVAGDRAAAVGEEIAVGRAPVEGAAVVIAGEAQLVVVVRRVVDPHPRQPREGPRVFAGYLVGPGDGPRDGIHDGAGVARVAPAVVLPEARTAEEIGRAGMVIGGDPAVVAVVVAGGDGAGAGEPAAVLALQGNVDDAGGAVGFVLGRGVGDDLDLVDLVGRELLQNLRAAPAHQRRGAAVDEDEHVVRATQAHVAIDVDLHGRDVLQQIAGRAGGALDFPADVVDLAVDRIQERLLLRLHLKLVQVQGGLGRVEPAQVDPRVLRVHDEPRGCAAVHPDLVVGEEIFTRRHLLEGEAAAAVGRRALHDGAVGLLEGHRDELDRPVGVRIDHRPRDAAVRRRRRGGVQRGKTEHDGKERAKDKITGTKGHGCGVEQEHPIIRQMTGRLLRG